jgi:glucose/mannose-6-phosphate isomerase
MCNSREVPHIKIPSNIQPRAAIAYILFSSILSLRKTGLLKNDLDSEIQEALEITNDLRNKIKKSIPEQDNIAKQMAKKIFNTFPNIYGWGIYNPIARRWHNQFNENSKILSRHDEVPECNHNDIIGWSMDPEISKKSTCILFRDSEYESIYMSTRLNFMKKLFDDVAANTIEIPVEGKKRLAKMMYVMYLGDYVSNYLAVLRNIDPTPIEAITILKNELAKI